MGTVTTKDGTEIFYKDWGTGEPIFFHHGWPLSADDWDAQMMFFLGKGYRVIAHDRRGHGRSTQTAAGHDMDTYADDAYEVVKKLDLKDAVHIGHSTGGGEVTRYVARHGKGRVKKAVLISAIPPLFMKTERNPDGVPKEVVDSIRDGTANHRSQFYKDITMPFYGFNRPGATISEGIRENWWRQGMMGSIQAQYECIRVLSETEFYDDLAQIEVPVLVIEVSPKLHPATDRTLWPFEPVWLGDATGRGAEPSTVSAASRPVAFRTLLASHRLKAAGCRSRCADERCCNHPAIRQAVLEHDRVTRTTSRSRTRRAVVH